MKAQSHLQAIDIHSHWSTRRGYPLQTETELAQQERTWRSKPEYRSEAEMAEDFRSAGCRRKIEMSPGVQSRDDTPVGESPRSASLRASRQ
jgi:hypothetical protein